MADINLTDATISGSSRSNGYLTGSNLERILRAGHFAVTGELGPPQSADGENIREKAQMLKGFCDAVNITDNQTAIVRMSSFAACNLLKTAGLDPVLQMVVRDPGHRVVRLQLQRLAIGGDRLTMEVDRRLQRRCSCRGIAGLRIQPARHGRQPCLRGSRIQNNRVVEYIHPKNRVVFAKQDGFFVR